MRLHATVFTFVKEQGTSSSRFPSVLKSYKGAFIKDVRNLGGGG